MNEKRCGLKYIITITLLLLSLLISVRGELSTKQFKLKSQKSLENPLNKDDYYELNEIFSLLEELHEVKPKQPSNFTEFFQDQHKFKNHTDGIICKSCLWTWKKIESFVKKRYGVETMYNILTFFCSYFTAKDVCHGVINHYGDAIITASINRYLTPEHMCTVTHLCSFEHYVDLSADAFAKELLKDKPKISVKNKTKAQTLKMLHVTDVHTDLEYLEGANTDCGKPLCCRASSGIPKSNFTKAGKWGTLGSCDLPLRTMENFLETVFNEIKPNFILWTGDNNAHDIWNSTQHLNFEATKIFTKKIKELDPNMIVFPVIGNHEKYPVDLYNFNDPKSEQKFLQSLGKFWKSWLDDEAFNSFLNYGFYTMKYKDLRIIALNSITCDIYNFWAIQDPTDPHGQFEWMINILRKSEKEDESVYIVGHIPPGDNSYLSECTKRYKAIIDRFSNIIKGQFFGHTHNDEFRLSTEYMNKDNVTGVMFTAPSLTTFSNLNPSFRVFEIDSETYKINDYIQYRFNITKANEEDSPNWEQVYKATEMLQISDLSDFNAFKGVIQQMNSSDDFLKKVIKAFYSDGPEYDVSIKDLKSARKHFMCRFKEDVFDSYLKCLNYISNSEDYINYFVESLSGDWFVLIKDQLEKRNLLRAQNEKSLGRSYTKKELEPNNNLKLKFLP